jgi:hypothetical protein
MNQQLVIEGRYILVPLGSYDSTKAAVRCAWA